MTNQVRLELPPPLTPGTFLERHWQKQPLFIPGGMPSMEPVITADELAWLATQPDVESRLVITEGPAERMRYRVLHGPFDERRLGRLPASRWTLLVHDVDKHLPDFRAYGDALPFLPDWRIDDLMISVAAPGGSVGPHRDQYDVFLCQASGGREWHLADPAAAVPAKGRSALALLEPFRAERPVTARPSDVLYLPPTVPHWGIAADACITFSIGMRAPVRSELVAALRRIASAEAERLAPPAGSPERFYADPDLQPDESAAGEIGARALARAIDLLAPPAGSRPAPAPLVARALGIVVTTPKDWLTPEMPDAREIDAIAAQLAVSGPLRVHGMARLAWCVPDGSPPQAYVNGRERPVTPELLVGFRQLCAQRALPANRCVEFAAPGADGELLRWLLAAGTFDLTDCGT